MPTVQWQVDTGSGFNDIPGENAATLMLAELPPPSEVMMGVSLTAVTEMVREELTVVVPSDT